MSGAGEALVRAVLTALRPIAGLSGAFEADPVQAADGHAIVEAGPETDWSHKSGAGREVRVAVTIRGAGESAQRLRALAGEAERALGAIAGDLPGWRIVSMQYLRGRTVREPKGRWASLIEFRARMLAR